MVNPAGLWLVATGVFFIIVAGPLARMSRSMRWWPGDPEYLDKIDARGQRLCGLILIVVGLLMFFGIIWQHDHWARPTPRAGPTMPR